MVNVVPIGVRLLILLLNFVPRLLSVLVAKLSRGWDTETYVDAKETDRIAS